MARQLAAGLVVGVMGVSIALSLATLVFRGDFADDLDHGIAWALVGLLTLGLVAALGSSIRGMAAGPQDVPSVVLAGVAVELGRVGATLPTLAAVVIVASTVTGMTMVAVGRQRLGGLVRFVPYSVMAAFLGGTGVVLIMAGWSALSGGWPMAGFGLRLVPGLVLAVALVWAARGGAPAATGAVLIGMGLVGYHLAAAVAGIDPADAVARGLVLGPFPSGSMFDPGVLGQLGQADWGAVLDQAPAIIVLGILTLLGMLLNLGGLEHELDRDVDIDRELEANGAGVLLAAPLGGLPGFVLLGNTLMARRLGGASRVPPVIAAGLALVVLAVGADVLTLVPVLITGGVLVTIGLDFVITWLWEVRHRVAIVEHGLILVIVAVIATVGFVEGVGLGILAATIMFVVRYSRVQAVHTFATLRDRRSHVQRSLADEAILDAVGHRVAIAELQGFVFFGTAEQVVAAVRHRLDGDDRTEVLVLDLARVTGLDSSAVASFQRLARRLHERNVDLVVTSAGPDAGGVLAAFGTQSGIVAASDLDHVLERQEERLLEHAAAVGTNVVEADVQDWSDGPWATVAQIRLPTGATIVTEGTRDAGLYLLEEGRASVRVGGDMASSRQAVLLPGTVVGELSLLTRRPANATVVCQTECIVRHLSTQTVDDMAATDPERALALYRFIARRLARKLDAAGRAITSLR